MPIVVGGTNYGAPLENLRSALKAEGLGDGLWGAFEAGVPRPFSDPSLEAFLQKSAVQVVKPIQYMDRWRLDRQGVRPIENDAQKQALGFDRR